MVATRAGLAGIEERLRGTAAEGGMKDAHRIIRTDPGDGEGHRASRRRRTSTCSGWTARANKIEIKQAVEELFNVNVTKVNTMNRQGKRKRERTSRYGRTSDWKRAVVTLKEGETIDLT